MKHIKSLALIVGVGLLGACSYGSIATAGNAVVITRNDSFLFGALRKMFACKPNAAEMTCQEVKGAP